MITDRFVGTFIIIKLKRVRTTKNGRIENDLSHEWPNENLGFKINACMAPCKRSSIVPPKDQRLIKV